MIGEANPIHVNHFTYRIEIDEMVFNLSVFSQDSKINLKEWDRLTRGRKDVPVLEDIYGINWIGLGARGHPDLQEALERNGIKADINNLTHMDLQIGNRRQVVSAAIPHSLDLANHSDERIIRSILAAIPEERVDSRFSMIEVDPSSESSRIKVIGSDKYSVITDSSNIGELKDVLSIEQHGEGRVKVTCRLVNFPKDLLIQ
jgi:hypothetical protein